MSENRKGATPRREFLKTSGKIAAGVTLLGTSARGVHAAESGLLQVALVGCGGRGTGAAAQALSVTSAPTKLVAMADVFEQKLAVRHKTLSKQFENTDKFDVPADRQFVGFDGYRKAMDCLKPGDIVILATPPAFRWVHFTYAIQKGLNVFMEKPVTVDGPTTRRMIELAKKADEKNLKVGVGLMVRHCKGRQQLKERIDGGEIGDIIAMRGYRMAQRSATCGPPPEGMTEVMHQIAKFHSFLWASGGLYSDYFIHQIDELSWMKGAWPVKAHALGGRHYREDASGNKFLDQNLDTYAVEYTYPDGTKLFYNGRAMSGCHNEFASYVHGTKGTAIVSTSAHHPGKVRTFKDQTLEPGSQIWAFPQPEPNPYQLEWNDLVDAIINDKKYNEVERGATASLVTSMGRMAAHTGNIVTYDQILASEHEFAPDVDKMTEDGPAPVEIKDGVYPVPMPGILKTEY
ncbi:MAG: Gfo/Idh/MocA family oxidoreductase [Planctomycetaceae bacterium]|nr:Gfo/Idh/MocA family oxidoreductase [Planctomycetaceae bacterium]